MSRLWGAIKGLVDLLLDNEPAVTISTLLAVVTQIGTVLVAFGIIGPETAEGWTSSATLALQALVPAIVGVGVWIRKIVYAPATVRRGLPLPGTLPPPTPDG